MSHNPNPSAMPEGHPKNVDPNFDPLSVCGPEFVDGTNVPAETKFHEEPGSRVLPWYVPSEAKGSHNWKDKLLKLKSRFDGVIDSACPVQCDIVQWLIPSAPKTMPALSPGPVDSCCLFAGPGLSCEPAKLLGPDYMPLVGEFPIKSVKGEPILTRDGKPVAYRLGFSRYFSVFAYPDGLRPIPTFPTIELMTDGGNLIYELPAYLAASLWGNWPSGFSKKRNQGKSLWLDLLAETSWKFDDGHPYFIDRCARFGNCSVVLEGDGLFPTIPELLTKGGGGILPHQGPYPMVLHSKIKDVARASVAVIDEILARDLDCEGRQNVASLGGKVDEQSQKAFKNNVFISYSHKDEKFLQDLRIHLKPLERSGQVTAWSDQQIDSGSKWFSEIQAALANAKIAVLLVSANFLASDFISDHELAPLLKRAEQEGVKILWIPVRSCSYKESPIQHYQAVIPPDKPLAKMKAERDDAWVKICQEIKKAL